MPQASSIHILSTCTTSDPQAKPTQHPGPAIAPVGTPQAGPYHANYRAPRDRTRHHIRRVRRAAAQSDRIGANATIAPKIAAWRHPQRIHWPRTAPQPRATLTRALTQARVLAPRSARSATRTAAADRQSSCYSHSLVDLRTGGGVGGTRAVAKAAPLLPAEQPRQRSGEAGSARRASALASTLATHLLAHQLVTA